MEPNNRMPRSRPDNPAVGQVVELPGAPIMIKGLKADFHVQRYAIKRSRCPFDAGFDLYVARSEPKVVSYPSQLIIIVNTMINVCLQPGMVGIVVERSSTMDKLNGARVKTGIIDSGYVGEILVCVTCDPSVATPTLDAIKSLAESETAIAQFLILPCYIPCFVSWDDRMIPRGRGDNGFGSTDIIGSTS